MCIMLSDKGSFLHSMIIWTPRGQPVLNIPIRRHELRPVGFEPVKGVLRARQAVHLGFETLASNIWDSDLKRTDSARLRAGILHRRIVIIILGIHITHITIIDIILTIIHSCIIN